MLTAVENIAEHGHKLLNSYQYDNESATWNYLGKAMASPVSLDDIFADRNEPPSIPDWDLEALLSQARELFNNQTLHFIPET